jgi:hypothetical protein
MLCRRIGDRQGEATALYNLGNAYLNVSAPRDLDRAERCYRDSLNLYDQQDFLGRAQCHSQLGQVAYERLWAAREVGASEQVLLGHWQAAADGYCRSRQCSPCRS